MASGAAGASVLGWIGVALLMGFAFALGWFFGARRNRTVAPILSRARSPTRPPAQAAPIRASSTAPVPLDESIPSVPPERTMLGRYRIERELGHGSMGTVYLGRDPQLGRALALKTMALSREFEGDQLTEARSRFFREAEMAGRLRHPDIVTIFDASEEQGLAFIAMEYLSGHDLQRYTQPDNLLPVGLVLHTLGRVARALAHAHAQGVLHRDVKPANVMVDLLGGSVKVTDFGIARITDACRTRTGLVLGTPSFMSPEQMAGRRLDGRTDLYSLGVMLFQLLTGSLPHRADSMAQLMYQIANETAPDVRTLRPELPEALANVVALALEKRVEVRYADGEQFASDLMEIAQAIDSAESQLGEFDPGGALQATAGSGRFEATAEFSRADPRHNADH